MVRGDKQFLLPNQMGGTGMSKALIIYHSVYGSTKKYAEWLSEVIESDVYDLDSFIPEMLNDYHTIILGGGLYAGKIKGLNFLKQIQRELRDQKIIIFTCGLADFKMKDNRDAVTKRVKRSLPKELFNRSKIFFLRGSIDYNQLSLIHRFMMWVMKSMLTRKGYDKLSGDDKLFVDIYGKSISFVDKESISDIVKECRE